MRAWKLFSLGLLTILLLAFTQPIPAAATSDSVDDPGQASEAARCVLITGANRGLGLEFAKQYKDAGWDVIGTARNPDDAMSLVNTGATVMKLDVTSDADVERLVKDLNGKTIDLLINNAGVSGRTPTLAELDADRTAHVLNVNLLGPMRVTNALMPNLRAGTGKTIISISSGLGSIARNNGGRYYGYRESKAGLNMFMRSIAMELKPEGFTCITMSPGWVRTDMGGPDATLSPQESITGMRKVIAELTPEKTGMFLGHDGTELPW